MVVINEAEFSTNCFSRTAVIACNHLDDNACFFAMRNGCNGFRAGRINHALKTEEDECVFNIFIFKFSLREWNVLCCNSEYAHTLRGEVLPIGGLKEKLLAAHRGGIKTVLIPEENVKDLTEIPDNIKNKLDIHPVKWIEQVLELALERLPEPLPDEPLVEAEAIAVADEKTEGTVAIKH